MSICEKCWSDARGEAGAYGELLKERQGVNQCTPEQQAGTHATACPDCHRFTWHQYADECMNQDCPGPHWEKE